MLQLLKLLLPALIPSWRFFDGVGPSPRIEFNIRANREDIAADWREFRPRAAVLSFPAMLRRLFWNPSGNESLFLVTTAERILETSSEFREQEIAARIACDVSRTAAAAHARPNLQFRLVLLSCGNASVAREVGYLSPVYSFGELIGT